MTKAKPTQPSPARHLVLGTICVALALGLLSMALNSGSLWQYAGVLVLIVIGARQIVSAIRRK